MEELKGFKDSIKGTNVSVNELCAYLGVSQIDVDYIDAAADITFNLVPDIRNYGLDGIDVVVTNVSAKIKWSFAVEYLTPSEIVELLAAGGTETMRGDIEGEVTIEVTNKTERWLITTEPDFGDKGSFSISEIEFDLSPKVGGKLNIITVS